MAQVFDLFSPKFPNTVSTGPLEQRNTVLREVEAGLPKGQDRFTIDELRNLNVWVKSVSFANIGKNAKPEWEPCYFYPYPFELLTPPREGVFDSLFPKYYPDPKETPGEHARSLWYYLRKYLPECGSRRPDVKFNIFYDLGWRKVSDMKYRNLWEYDTVIRPHWYVEAVYVFAGPESAPRPQTKCALISDFDGDDETLLRSEVIALSRIIRRRNVNTHEVQPVLMFSMMGPRHIRILHAHWTGLQLIIQKSPLYDLRQEDEDVLALLSRWFLSMPTGDTRLAGY
ncbi:hypothetical protein DTO166G4_5910 [Paecilomyces variotii]|uniref:Uncharacterized protein n=1 Tax=Byssochlamys spectabilis TaxID=264951 RepID=A0A443HIY6_BYSSP|nr:hypothetical protein C8Q69DRAFT_448134 [Paecilomyces variotii]KAJ9212549.1 hypothetical protein DTO166G4_5910 [Paecilomyces variotii]KAJ9237072.1 hypothetical protein DTO166G5_3757 [Paecilomyces variotii]KAJ9238835.1 hypothetical protein DTO169E5_4668 [Paecilomyces variotii]KAJ9248474.1 hypothetical protein DTO195F2_8832 [Paecilomyces variotii]KAJ9258672.1 hypothetical protein DTO207G8_1375 [Paecilomyces variotii]